VREQGSGTRIAMERFFNQHGIQLQAGMVMSSNEAIKQAVQAGWLGDFVAAHHRPGAGNQAAESAGRQRLPHHAPLVCGAPQDKRLSTVAQAFKAFC